MQAFLKRTRVYFYYAFFFSLFINLLMLTLPVYMLQVFDRVISSRSEETLVVLTLAAVFGLSLHMILSLLRERLLLGSGVALDGNGRASSAARGTENGSETWPERIYRRFTRCGHNPQLSQRDRYYRLV